MPTYAATGITLLAHKYKGTNCIATFYTRERGKVKAAVSGIGKPKSKLAPAVQPLTLSKLFFAEGRDLDRLTQCEIVEQFYDLRRDVHRFAFACYAAELVAKTTERGQGNEAVYEALEETLHAVVGADQPELVIWAFVLKYLWLEGIGPSFERCIDCGRPLSGVAYWATDLGGCACENCAAPEHRSLTIDPQTRGAAKSILTMPAGRIDRIKITPASHNQLRAALRSHITYHIGVNLKTEDFMDKMRRAGRSRQ